MRGAILVAVCALAAAAAAFWTLGTEGEGEPAEDARYERALSKAKAQWRRFVEEPSEDALAPPEEDAGAVPHKAPDDAAVDAKALDQTPAVAPSNAP